MILGLNGVMKHAHDMDRLLGNTIENIVLIDFELPIASPDIVTETPSRGLFRMVSIADSSSSKYLSA